MDLLIRQVRIIDPSSPFHLQTIDLFIHNGKIAEASTASSENIREVSVEGLCASPGWVDIFAHFCDPGFEYRETLETGAAAAAAGGYTDVMVLPNTSPVTHSKSGIEYFIQRGRTLPVNIHPIGAITRNNEGKELAEMYDMHASGAAAFSDGLNTIQSSGIMLKALQYVKAIDKTVIQLPDDRSVTVGGLMNEGVASTGLGLPGMPAIGEELMIHRDMELAAYTDSRLHITGVSTANSLQLIARAKKAGVKVTCSVTPHHLLFCDEDLSTYDTNLKLNPPLRTRADMQALRDGVIDGTIDCLASHHLPQDRDHKEVEFEYAGFGMSGLETAYAELITAIPGLSQQKLVAMLSENPRSIFNLPRVKIAPGEEACITLFQPHLNNRVSTLRSRSKNNALLGKELMGRVAGIINKDRLFLAE